MCSTSKPHVYKKWSRVMLATATLQWRYFYKTISRTIQNPKYLRSVEIIMWREWSLDHVLKHQCLSPTYTYTYASHTSALHRNPCFLRYLRTVKDFGLSRESEMPGAPSGDSRNFGKSRVGFKRMGVYFSLHSFTHLTMSTNQPSILLRFTTCYSHVICRRRKRARRQKCDCK